MTLITYLEIGNIQVIASDTLVGYPGNESGEEEKIFNYGNSCMAIYGVKSTALIDLIKRSADVEPIINQIEANKDEFISKSGVDSTNIIFSINKDKPYHLSFSKNHDAVIKRLSDINYYKLDEGFIFFGTQNEEDRFDVEYGNALFSKCENLYNEMKKHRRYDYKEETTLQEFIGMLYRNHVFAGELESPTIGGSVTISIKSDEVWNGPMNLERYYKID